VTAGLCGTPFLQRFQSCAEAGDQAKILAMSISGKTLITGAQRAQVLRTRRSDHGALFPCHAFCLLSLSS